MSKQLAIAYLLCTAHLSALADSPVVVNPENGHRYQRFDTNMTWHEAKLFCENMGGYLATITSASEDVFVWNNIASSSPNSWTWLGATDEASEGEWIWITGEPWSYSNWDYYQPDGLESENYLHYWGGTDDKWWNDVSNEGWVLSTLCETGGAPFASFASFSTQVELEFGPRMADDSFQGTAKFELSPDSNGIDPVYEDITLTLGTLSITIPAGSFKAWRRDEAPDRVRFRGAIDGVRMTAIIFSKGVNNHLLWVKASGAKLDGFGIPPVIALAIGDDYGQTILNLGQTELKTLGSSTIYIVSEGSDVDPDESNSMSSKTIPIEPNSAWFGPLTHSNDPAWQGDPIISDWVSYFPSDSGDASTPDNTVVSFFDDFDLKGEPISGSISVLADDTAAVFLNGHLVFSEATPDQSYSLCSDVPIGCLEATMATLDLTPFLKQGENRLEIQVAQRGGGGYGLNYVGQVVTLDSD